MYICKVNIKSMTYINTTTLTFANQISRSELSLFRGAVISCCKDHASQLFHNHTDTGYRNAYPLIQYRMVGSRMALVGLCEGADVLMEVKPMLCGPMLLGRRTVLSQLSACSRTASLVGLSETMLQYHISDWLPLNQENFRQYESTADSLLRVQMLQKILVGNMLSFFKGVGVHIDSQLYCQFDSEPVVRKLPYKQVDMMGVDVDFQLNAHLPLGVGVGKGCSLGFGSISYR